MARADQYGNYVESSRPVRIQIQPRWLPPVRTSIGRLPLTGDPSITARRTSQGLADRPRRRPSHPGEPAVKEAGDEMRSLRQRRKRRKKRDHRCFHEVKYVPNTQAWLHLVEDAVLKKGQLATQLV